MNVPVNGHSSGALGHIRVLDLSRVLAGPWATQTLADLGADVIKVERPGSGDDTRQCGPPYLRNAEGHDTTEAAYYLAANRGKRSITVDISQPEGQAIIRDLACQSDVLVENYKVGDFERYGLSYEELSALNPRLVYCSITGFGQSGPSSHLAGYDFVAQAMGGMMSITGERDDKPGGGPQKTGVAFADLMTGMYATVSILAALEHRNISGRGQYIDLALLDVQVASLANMNMNYLCSGIIPGRHGNAHANIVPYQAFECADGGIVIAAGNDRQFAAFASVAEHPEWATDPRFATNRARVENRAELLRQIEAIMLLRSRYVWLAELATVGVPSGSINNIEEVFSEPQIQYRQLKISMPHPSAGDVALVGSPIRMSDTPVAYRMPPPRLGEHSERVLADRLGMDEHEIARLREIGVI